MFHLQIQRKEKSSNTNKLFWEHVADLRRLLFFAIAITTASAVFVHSYRVVIIDFLLVQADTYKIVFLSPLDPILFIMKLDILGGILLSVPLILLLIFDYLRPVIGGKARLYIPVIVVGSFVALSMAFFYTFWVLLPLALEFLVNVQVGNIELFFSAKEYFNFVLLQLILTSIIFHIPFVIVALTFFDIVSPKLLGSKRFHVYIAITIFFAFLTPTPDIFNLLIVLLPAIIVFEISLVCSRLIQVFRYENK